LLAGASLTFVSWEARGRLPIILGVVGLAFIGVSVATFGPQSQVPGLIAAIPCLGALLLIHIGQSRPDNLVSRALAISPLVGVGLISYALYLWHWPINVFLRRYVLLDPPGPLITALAIAAAFALAAASWFLIERPLRQGSLLKRPARAFGFAALLSAILIGVGAWMATSDGLPWRFPGLAAVAMQPGEARQRYDLRNVGRGTFGDKTEWLVQSSDPAARRVLLWGDSYAGHLHAGLAAVTPGQRISALQHTYHACPPVLGFDPVNLPACKARNDAALTLIARERIDTVILAGRWDSYLATGKLDLALLSDTVRRLQSMGLKVIVVGQPPNYAFDFPDEYHYRQVRAGRAGADEGWAPNVADRSVNMRLRALIGPALFDPTPLFCQDDRCQYRAACLYLVSDNGHLTAAGSERLVRAMLPALGDGR
jgi:hypothetical protein